MKYIFTYILFSVTTLSSFSQQLTLRLSSTPETVLINGSATAYLEYFITNNSTDTLVLEKLELVTNESTATILSLDRSQLRTRLHRPEFKTKVDATVMPPGTTNVLYLEPVLKTGKDQAQQAVLLRYTVNHGGRKENHTFRGSLVLKKKAPLVLGTPLREGTWVAVYDPAWERGHRRVLYKGDSAMHLPGRYAIDFIRVDDQGRYARDNEDAIGNWYGYSADVLAVSDGTVLSVRTNFPESATLSAHHQPGPEDATGNYIALQVSSDRVAFYEHLKPGSIRVQPGQRVKKGDVIASLGFTGQSTGPHLHFHVADRNSPLRAEGVPFVFESFKMLGAYTNLENFGSKMWSPVKNKVVLQERPAPNTVIVFE
ncbi:peptidoglycan DD-metalloendopeptidase family protein [Fulvivirgaceae bacterium PWU4]|uniref:Peptidoglycan DD-metalloendopeptidase family protein n=1 Tax=Chryseosolibacter histidini TaxID=2782349 RepID=A0AAP2DJ42_9BACT|nr:M23 family metallopeptidase [Chryseosolibacter histidini]MBT1695937.1 peptidoglycan DD-metalloendopeptidase family protein [Chryseosolibacter histidini]